MSDMPDANPGLTDRVLKSYSSIEEPRLRSLVLALIRHMHAYIGETKLTDQEWEFAWNFMGRMAAVSDRNEFLLAGDVLGVSQLIETLNHDRPGQSVGFALVGPFLGSDSHLMIFLPSLRFSTGESAPCEPVFELRRLCRVGWLSRA